MYHATKTSNLVSSFLWEELNLLDDMNLCWSVVWKIFPEVAALDPDKQVVICIFRLSCVRLVLISHIFLVLIVAVGKPSGHAQCFNWRFVRFRV